MKILRSEQLDISKISKTCKAYLFIIEIDDVSQNASELINILNDKTWLSKLDFLSKSNFEECAKATIKKMLSIFNDAQSTSSIKDEFGEYMVDAGFNLVSTANNHCLDKGSIGIKNSYDFWSQQSGVLLQ